MDEILNIIISKSGNTTVRRSVIYKEDFAPYIVTCNRCRPALLHDTKQTDYTKEEAISKAKYLFITDERNEGEIFFHVRYGKNFKLIDSFKGKSYCYNKDAIIFRNCEFFGFTPMEKFNLFLEAERYLAKRKVIVFIDEDLYMCAPETKIFNENIRCNEDFFFCFKNCPIRHIVDEYIKEYHPPVFYVSKTDLAHIYSVKGEGVDLTTGRPTDIVEKFVK